MEFAALVIIIESTEIIIEYMKTSRDMLIGLIK